MSNIASDSKVHQGNTKTIAFRVGDDEERALRRIAAREREGVSVVARRFIRLGLDAERRNSDGGEAA